MDASATTQRPLPLIQLLRDLRDEAVLLFRKEVELAKTEVAHKGSVAAQNLAHLAIGGAIAYAGALILLGALAILAAWGLTAAGVDAGIAAWLGPGIVGLIVAGIGFALVQKARRKLTSNSLMPQETVASLKENTQWTKEKLTHT